MGRFLYYCEDKEEREKLTKIKSFGALPPPPLSASEKRLYYKSLAVRGQGELRKFGAIKMAKERNFKPEIIHLLENTIFYEFGEIIGRPQCWRFGDPDYRFHQLYYANRARFELEMPSQPAIQFSTEMETAQTKEMTDEEKSSIMKIDGMVLLIRCDTPFAVQVGVLENILTNARFPENFTHVDLFTYILVACDMLDEFFIEGQKLKQWTPQDPLKGVLLRQTLCNIAHHGHYKKLKEEIKKMKNEVHWDGHQPAGFRKKLRQVTNDDVIDDVIDDVTDDGVADDDCSEDPAAVERREMYLARETKPIKEWEKLHHTWLAEYENLVPEEKNRGALYKVLEVGTDHDVDWDTGGEVYHYCYNSPLRDRLAHLFCEMTLPFKIEEEIIIQNKASLKFFGGLQARSVLGIGAVDAEITTDMLEHFYVWKRNFNLSYRLKPGMRILYY
eukprot:Phypoly_transcript_02699.p1 GENE.Phypoly_transcript_02699~~Phypoly_transcript_02699.p1  ORF type:complete len:444 (+),score=74.39 Phypoly_transcript_02699:1069-2400(+)